MFKQKQYSHMQKELCYCLCISKGTNLQSQNGLPTTLLPHWQKWYCPGFSGSLTHTTSFGGASRKRCSLTWIFFWLFSLLTTSSENSSHLFVEPVYFAEIEPERNEFPQCHVILIFRVELWDMRKLSWGNCYYYALSAILLCLACVF